MAAPFQIPRISLPGAEYFSVAPNATFAMQGMRRINLLTGPVLIPASTTQTLTMAGTQNLIETGFPPGAGVYVRSLQGFVGPQDTTGSLTVEAVRMGLAVSAAANLAYDIGLPLATLTSPRGTLVVIAEREILVTQRDVQAFDSAQPSPVLPLFVNLFVTLANFDAANPHSATLALKMVYSRIDGVTE